MSLSLTRPLAPLAVLLAIGLALAGCSGGSGGDPYAVPSHSGTAPAEGSSANAPASTAPATLVPTDVPSSGAQVAAGTLAARIASAARSKGSVNFAAISQGAQSISGNGQAKGFGSSGQMNLTATISGGTIQIVRLGSTVYLKAPAPISGKPWLKITPGSSDPFARVYLEVFQGMQDSADVVTTSTKIAQMGTFRQAATEPVDGVSTTKYMAQPPASVGVKLLPQAFQGLQAVQLKSAKTVVSVWVDGSGLLRRTAVTFAMKGVPTTQTLVSYTNWGAPVTVSAPPASQVGTGIKAP